MHCWLIYHVYNYKTKVKTAHYAVEMNCKGQFADVSANHCIVTKESQSVEQHSRET